MNQDLISCPEQAYFVQPYGGTAEGLVRHVMGASELDHPACPCGSGTMLSLLELNTLDRRLGLEMVPAATLQLIWCPSCRPGRLCYTFHPTGEIRVESRSSTGGDWAGVEGSVLLGRKKNVLLHAIPDQVVKTRALAQEGRLAEGPGWAERFAWDAPRCQVGGKPWLRNSMLRNPACEDCESSMPFLASLVLGVSVAVPTGELQLVYFLCRDCSLVTLLTDGSEQDYS